MMRILLLGAKGMLGKELQSIFTGNADVYIDNKSTLDITNKKMVIKRIKEVEPDTVINCAEIADIDEAEKNKDLSMKVNGYAVEHIAKACEMIGSRLVQFSTHDVFDGNQNAPYTEHCKKFPVSVYGKSKSLGEDLALNSCSQVYVIRSSWVFGSHANNYINNILDQAKNQEVIRVPANIVIAPTWCKDLGLHVRDLLEENIPYGIYHFTNDGEISYADFAKQILKLKNINKDVVEIPNKEFGYNAKRPQYGVLENTKTENLRHWEESIRDYLGVY